MELEFCIKQMTNHAEIIQRLVSDASEEQGQWKPDAETWSLKEVMGHLYREERGDFRAHLQNYPSPTGAGWPSVDPTGREYDLSSLADTLQGFLDERQKSIKWLQMLESPDWDSELEISFVDSSQSFSMGEMMASWVAHDLLHMRQLVEVHWAFTLQGLSPYPVEYAGGW